MNPELTDMNMSRTWPRWMSIALYALGVLLFLLYHSVSVVLKEKKIAASIPILLEFRPVDPRSLVQGDYMLVGLHLERQIENAQDCKALTHNEQVGRIAQNTSGYARLKIKEVQDHTTTPVYELDSLVDVAPDGQDLKAPVLNYKNNNCRITVGSGNYFFQEGSGDLFQQARYVRMLIAADGSSYTGALLDKDFNTIEARSLRDGVLD